MKNSEKLCSICSTLLTCGNSTKQKLLQTPCNHVFHRTCLKTWFRKEPPENRCPKCQRPATWNEARVWQGLPDEACKGSRDSKPALESSISTVPSLMEEIRKKKAEELVEKRKARKSDQTTLKEYEKRDLLERQRLAAQEKRQAGIKSKASAAEDKRQRLKLLKRIFVGSILLLLLFSLSIFTYKFVRQTFPTFHEKMETITEFCFKRLGNIQVLYKEAAFILEVLKKVKKEDLRDDAFFAKIQGYLKRVEVIEKEIIMAQDEIDRLCIPNLEERLVEFERDFTKKMTRYKGNGWSRIDFHSKETLLRQQKMQQNLLDRYDVEGRPDYTQNRIGIRTN